MLLARISQPKRRHRPLEAVKCSWTNNVTTATRGVPFKPDEGSPVRIAGYWLGPSHSVERGKGANVLRNVAAALLGRGRVCVSIRHLLSWFTFADSGPCRSVIPFHADHPGVSE